MADSEFRQFLALNMFGGGAASQVTMDRDVLLDDVTELTAAYLREHAGDHVDCRHGVCCADPLANIIQPALSRQ